MNCFREVRTRGVAAIATILLLALPSFAVRADEGQQGQDDWTFFADAYLWGANIDIESETGSNTEIRFTDIVDDMQFGGMAVLGASHNKWFLWTDAIYLDIDDNVEEEIESGVELDKLGVEAWVVQPKIGYQVMRTERNALYALAGLRYLWVEVYGKLDLGPPNPVGSQDGDVSDSSWDAVVGFRGEYLLSDKWYINYQFDGGAGDSDFTWQLIGAVGYRFESFDATFGYRYLDWEDTENDALADINMSGFMAGVRLHF